MSPLPPLSTRGLGPITRIRARIIERRVAARNRKAEDFLRSAPHLWRAIEDYKKVSDVTGASMSDYRTLYEQVREHKPREILELGTGFSSVILAHALMENEKEGAPKGRITSMEEHEGWFEKASEVLPENVRDHVEIIHSPKVDGFYKIFRGVQYREIPDRDYDFVFSDGPERHSTINGDKLFDLDLVQIVRRSEKPVRAVVDNHYLTFYVLQKVFGTELARYSVSHRLMFVGPVTKHDVRRLRKENFLPDLRLLSTTELKMRMAR
ncbi:MAG: class I SAM-dependent methyltransferase [Methyloligellaceae bacterium]